RTGTDEAAPPSACAPASRTPTRPTPTLARNALRSVFMPALLSGGEWSSRIIPGADARGRLLDAQPKPLAHEHREGQQHDRKPQRHHRDRGQQRQHERKNGEKPRRTHTHPSAGDLSKKTASRRGEPRVSYRRPGPSGGTTRRTPRSASTTG